MPEDIEIHRPSEAEQQQYGLTSNRPPNAADTDENNPYTGTNPFLG